MNSALQVHPSWLRDGLLTRSSASPTSATWNWFYLERWANSTEFTRNEVPLDFEIDAEAPGAYGAIVLTAMWIVAESLRRDGISRNKLNADDMRWARRLGLALLGDSPVHGFDGKRAGDKHSDLQSVVARIVDLFPKADQTLLRLALPAAQRPDDFHEPASLVSTRKTIMLVRLAKRHAAAAMGVDLKQEPMTVNTSAAERHDASLDLMDLEPSFFEEMANAG